MTANDHLGPEAAKRLAQQHRAEPPTFKYGSVEYWENRARLAEASLERLQRQMSDRGWELENHRRDAQDRRDREIGEMGGGG
jgi:hypothetical protein